MTNVSLPQIDYSEENLENRVVRVFVSSTFKDMQNERDYLMERIFPKIRIYCKERDVEFIPIDLRCGITLEQSESGQVAEICLREIKKSRPFFIGLLGERYGWIPQPGQVSKNPEFPFVEEDIANGLSITEMEIQYGVLRFPEKIDAAFWFRSSQMETPDEFKEIPDTEPYRKLLALKSRIEESSYPHAEYLSPQDLGRLAEEALKNWIDRRFPENVRLTWLEKQNLQQRVFERSRRRLYVPNNCDYQALDAFIDDDERQVLAVTGPSGLGKSSLLINWVARYGEARQDDAFIVAHYVSASEGSENPANILRRLTETLDPTTAATEDSNEFLNEASPKAKTLEDQTKEFARAVQKWRSENSGKKLLFVLDGLNQIPDQDDAKELVWLPALPKGVKLVLSTINSDKTNDAIVRRGWTIYEAAPLSQEQIENVTTEFLKSRGRELTREQYARIASHEIMTNPMALRTLLDQLCSFGEFGQKGEKLDAEIKRYLDASSLEELFDKTLESLEAGEQGAKVRTLARAIGAARYGMTENELLEFTGYSQFDVSWFLCVLDDQLVNRSGRYSFSHEHIRSAVERRSGDSLATTREELVRFFSRKRGNDAQNRKQIFKRGCQEIPFQLMKLEAWDRLYAFLLHARVLDELYNGKLVCDYCVYWNALVKTDKEKYSFQKLLEINDAEYSESKKADLWSRIEYLAYEYNQFDASEKACLRSLESVRNLVKDNPGAYLSRLATLLNNLARLHAKTGRFQDAEKEYADALEIIRTIAEENPDAHLPRLATLLNNLARLHAKTGRFQDAEKEYADSLEILRRLAKNNPGIFLNNLAAPLNNLAILHTKTGLFQDAENEYTEALEIRRRLVKDNPNAYLPDLAGSLNNLATLHTKTGRFQDAEKEHTEALEIRRSLAKDNPNAFLHDLAESLNNLANLHGKAKRFQVAEKEHMEALGIIRNLTKDNPNAYLSDLATSLNNLAILHYDAGRFQDAEKEHTEAVEIRRKLSEDNPKAYLADLALSLYNLAILYQHTERLHDAEKEYAEALRIIRNVARDNPGRYLTYLAQTLNNLAVLHKNTGRLQDAEKEYLEALGIYRSLSKNNPKVYLPTLAQSLNGLAYGVYLKTGHYQEAEEALLEAVDIQRKFAAVDPDKNEISLAYFLDSLAEVYFKQRRFSEARTPQEESIAILRRRVTTPGGSLAKVLVDALTRLSEICQNLGLTAKAEKERAEASALRQKLDAQDAGQAKS